MQAQRNLKEIVAENINNIMVEWGKSRRQVCNDLEIKYTTFCVRYLQIQIITSLKKK